MSKEENRRGLNLDDVRSYLVIRATLDSRRNKSLYASLLKSLLLVFLAGFVH